MALVAVCLVACAGRPASKPPERAIEASDLYPLEQGNAWSYDVDTGERSTTLAVTRVESFDGRVAKVRTGDTLIEYEVRPEGVCVPSENAWVVREPLRRGARWPARGGRTAEVVSMHARVDTAFDRLEGCVEVVEVGGRLDLEIRTVYCPGVGPASVISTMRSTVSERTLTVAARLRGYEVQSRSPTTR